MKRQMANSSDVFGIAKPAVDAHTLGVSVAEQILSDCGFRVALADEDVCIAAGQPAKLGSIDVLEEWIRDERITRLGFSYRLDASEGADLFSHLVHQLRTRHLLSDRGGPLNALYFAGLPDACERVKREHGDLIETFCGDETPGETLSLLGVNPSLWPSEMSEEIAYDDSRMRFARDLIRAEKHLAVRPVDRSGYPEFGTASDSLIARLRHGSRHELPPLMRAHVGPYLPNREEAVALFMDWTARLAKEGLLDVLSIGGSQLTQSDFGEEWGDRPNGGGVPINSPQEFEAVWRTARPMLVRTYAGTTRMPELAKMYDETIRNAWHTFSLWWFSRIDGRGPLSLRKNLTEHLETLSYVARSGKPFEPNVPHHFGFRGSDDVTYVVSGVLAARTAKRAGVRHLVLQVMLNTPKHSWGVQDLAKSRALLSLVRELEDDRFRVILQPRAGLDYFSHDLEKAKAQLAAVTALMDDIEPENAGSPEAIHVVSYSEGSHLADPPVIGESVRITRAALTEYRALRRRGEVEDMARHPEANRRCEELIAGARDVLDIMEAAIPNLYGAEGLYLAFAAGFLPVPYLWRCREEFPEAIRWRTKASKGGVIVVDEAGRAIPPRERALAAASVVPSLLAADR